MVNGSGFRRAAIFEVNDLNKNTLLGTIDGFDYSAASSINNSGQIVGCAYIGPIPDQARAVRFDPSGQGNNIDLGTLGGEYSAAFSINDHGQIVGSAYTTTGQRHATLFDPNGTGNNIDLGTVAGCNGSTAGSINNRGQIVGQANNFPLASPMLAILFDPTGGGNNIELNGLINPELGWSLGCATRINDHGQIVGAGTNPDGDHRAVLLTPATPGDLEPDRDVDFEDFAVFASAWKSKDGDTNWNVFCDICCPEDGVVDELGLSVFCSNWLAQQ
jgi:probable HAF family extracellular repeat protein